MLKDQDAPLRKPVFLRRFPQELHQQLTEEARAAERSLTAEIIFRLRASLKRKAEKAAA